MSLSMPPPLPPKIQAAIMLLTVTQSRRSRRSRWDTAPPPARPSQEIATRNAALELLRNWFTGEIELESPPPPSFDSPLDALRGQAEDQTEEACEE